MDPRIVVATIVLWANFYGVPTDLAMEICRLESGFDPYAVGDGGEAVGLWQWHPESYLHVADKMTARGVWDREGKLEDRQDPWLSTRAAMYAMGEMGLTDWWSTAEEAERNARERGG